VSELRLFFQLRKLLTGFIANMHRSLVAVGRRSSVDHFRAPMPDAPKSVIGVGS